MTAMVRAVIVIALSITCAGCFGAVLATDVSRPSREPGELYPVNPDGSIALPGIVLAVIPKNSGAMGGLLGPVPLLPVWAGSPARPAGEFWISVQMDPEGEDFTFDPGGVALRLVAGEPLAPSAVSGPGPGSWRSGAPVWSAWSCGVQTDRARPLTGPIGVTQLSCVSVRFSVATPSTEHEFWVTVAGIARAGRTVPPVTVRFVRGKVWEAGSAL